MSELSLREARYQFPAEKIYHIISGEAAQRFNSFAHFGAVDNRSAALLRRSVVRPWYWRRGGTSL